MTNSRLSTNSLVYLAAAAGLAFPAAAHAYIGPGIIVGAAGALLGWVAAVVAALLMILSWPAYLLYKKIKKNKAEKGQEPPKQP